MSWIKEDFEKLRNRDSAAFEKLYEMYKGKLYNYFMVKSGGDQDLAAELLSETFYSAINSVTTLKNSSNIQGWIFQIAVRRFNDHLRRAYKTSGTDQMDEFVAPDSGSAERSVIEKEKIALLYVALDKIKPAYREILNLKYFLNNSEKDISIKTGKSVGAVEGLLYRARQALKKELGVNSDLFMEEP